MLPVRVVIFIECIEGGDLVECGALHHVGKGIAPRRHHDFATGEALAKSVVERRDLARHHYGLLNQAGKHKSGCDGVATALLAIAAVLIWLHLCRVIAALRHTDRWANAVARSMTQ